MKSNVPKVWYHIQIVEFIGTIKLIINNNLNDKWHQLYTHTCNIHDPGSRFVNALLLQQLKNRRSG